MTTARKLQERAARALPAEYVEDNDGWLLRHTPDSPWWANAALPHGDPGADDLARRVAEAEAFYAGHGTAACFQLTPGACPEALDTVLTERGYRVGTSASLQVATTAQLLRPESTGTPRVRLDDRPTRAWLEAWQAVNGGDIPSRLDRLGRVERPSAYASAVIDGSVVAVGRTVADTGWAGVFSIATLPEARGRGAARAVLAALAGWAGSQGANRMYLQVESDNAAARRLYERAGFTELCGYHYRAATG